MNCSDRLTVGSKGHYITCTLSKGHEGNHHGSLYERDIYWTPVAPLTPWEAIVAEAVQVISLGNDDQYLGGQVLAEMILNYDKEAESNG